MKKTKQKASQKTASKKPVQKKSGQFSVFLQSFKTMDARYLIAGLYLVGLIILAQIGVWLLNSSFSMMEKKLLYLDEAQLESAAIGTYAFVLFAFLLFFLVMVFFASTAEIGIWSAIMKKKFKFNVKMILKLFLANLVWFGAAVTVFVLMVTLLESSPGWFLLLLLIFGAIFVHLTLCFNYCYVASGRVIKAIKDSLKIAVLKLHKFLFAALAFSVFFVITSVIYYLLIFVSEVAATGFLAVVMLFLLLWLKFYYALIIESTQQSSKDKRK